MKVKLPVDAGNISFADSKWIKSLGGSIPKQKGLVHTLDCFPRGAYTITYTLPNTWNGKVKGKGSITLTGKLIIGDLCYLFANDKAWTDFLAKTDYFRIPFPEYISVDTGGDGMFDVTFTVK